MYGTAFTTRVVKKKEKKKRRATTNAPAGSAGFSCDMQM